jgi:hypothetical protein
MYISDITDERTLSYRLSAASPPKRSASFPITVPPKVWRPKPPSRYTPLDYGSEFSDDLFAFPRFGKSLKIDMTGPELPPREDVRLWNATTDQEEFDRVIWLPPHIAQDLRSELVSIIQDNWDCFYEEGVNRPIRGFEFRIDTGSAQPVACRPPNYGIHEGRIMQAHIDDLLHKGWIHKCGGGWCSKIVLAPKPHQEHVTDIKRFCLAILRKL